jgi:hypothetical protein
LIRDLRWTLIYEHPPLSSDICLSKKTYPKFLRIIQETNFDMGFQKINIRDRYKKSGLFLGVSLILSHLNEPKKVFNKLPSWDILFFKLQLLVYIKIQKTKNFGVPPKKIFFTFGP